MGIHGPGIKWIMTVSGRVLPKITRYNHKGDIKLWQRN
jgi:hypothetical protein